MPIRKAIDYHPGITSASKSVLLELMTVLKAYRDSLVLIGGWAPYFLLEIYKPEDIEFTHIGSIDIDLIIDPEVIDESKYKTITRILLDREYKPSKEVLYQFERTVKSKFDNMNYTVRIDFLSPQPPKGKGRTKRHRQIQPDLKARNLSGAEIALELNQRITIEGILPEDGETKIELKMANLTSFLTLKGIAFGERYQEKDAYDIYTICNYYKEGPLSVAEEIKSCKGIEIVRKGLDSIRQRFRDIKAEGPSWVANFMAINDEKEKENIKQRSFMVVNEMLKSLDIG